MKIYTRTGDNGTTSLSGGRRLPKHHVRVEAYGTIDELIAWIGLLRDQRENSNRNEILVYIQNQLMASAAALAFDNDNTKVRKILPEENCISVIEAEIDKMESVLPPLKTFIMPGGSGNPVISYCHITRCVCRRAERAITRINSTEYSPEIIKKFLNRLSDFLFVLSRKLCLELDIEEHTYTL